MPQNASSAALQALTEWWEEMGVEVDHAQIRAAQAAITAAPDPAAPSSAPAIDVPATKAPLKRRTKNKSHDDWIAQARMLANGANDLPALKAAIESFDGCDLKKLSNKTVTYDGTLGAPIMVIGEGPGPDEDRLGLPFVGKAGQLLDRMLGTIGLDRMTNTFISNVNYWRPPGNRNPEDEELALCRPFVDRMIDLAQPKVIIATGGVAAKSLLDSKTGIMRLRGSERPFATPAGTQAPLFPILHPAYLLRRPQNKSRAWRDLLLVRARLNEMGIKT